MSVAAETQTIAAQREERPPAIRLRGLRKSFGTARAVAGVDMDIADGEFFAMLGPSGSGKTTILRMIAGFEQPSGGTITLDGKDVTGLAPFQRDVHTVFQDYALFPHMTVLENIAYGLRVRRVPKGERLDRAREALDTVRLGDYADRKPNQLSGGQRQRIALARALVNRPKVLLLDEPLGALDLKLRTAMQLELKQLQREVGITFVFVTHDQEEALTMSDRIAVINEGNIEQIGTPAEIYEAPGSAFVAGFVGTSNLLEPAAAEQIVGERATFSVRPEKIRLDTELGTPAAPDEFTAPGVLREVVFTGPSTRYVVELDAGGTLSALRQNDGATNAGPRTADRVRLSWACEHNFRIASSTTNESTTGGK
ncbi:ABC transporter ATP-binding protein [Sciscionella sediminilitoris]|uniref:ABC transporter ATP-binding protein n=1 Tax=Sciscionella sediminilitoris TaxID=1445613 RepID=UPI00068B46AA|nr:ABC transporter ATP-binding protein [Sciscionella sp. SE31]